MLIALPLNADNRILSPRFKTLTSTVNGDWFNRPVMQLNSHDVLTVSFDELSHNFHRLCYRIEHCEYDWTTSESLFESDWLEGFNNNPISMPRCREILAENGIEPARYFKAEFVSSEMKLLKPSEAFYREVVRRIGLPPEQLLFIDDSMANVEGARAVGIQAVHFVQGRNLEECIATAIRASEP